MSTVDTGPLTAVGAIDERVVCNEAWKRLGLHVCSGPAPGPWNMPAKGTLEMLYRQQIITSKHVALSGLMIRGHPAGRS